MDVQDQLAQIKEETLKSTIGEPMLKALRDQIVKGLSGLTQKAEVSVSIAWGKMGLRDKLKWWVVNCLMPTVGKHVRALHQTADSLEAMADQTILTRAREDGYQLPCVPKLPLWATRDPKMVLLCDMKILPIVPAQFITVNFNVARSQGEDGLPDAQP